MMVSLVADELVTMGESGGTRYMEDQTEGTKLWLSSSSRAGAAKQPEEGPPE